MPDEKTFKKILMNKYASINILFYKLKDTEEESWIKTSDGIRERKLSDVPLEELMAYSEAFLFECGSFLDILMKYICNKGLRVDFDFNYTNLSKLSSVDEFVTLLDDLYSKGASDSPIYNLKKMKEYRNAITHSTILDISKVFMWKKGDSFPELENNYYLLPDNPSDEFNSYTYHNRIPLFKFMQEMAKIFEIIVNKINVEKLYGKYSV